MASTIDRLLELPVVFSLADAGKTGAGTGEPLGGEHLHTFLARAVKRGRIASAGPKSGIYYNLVRDPNARTRVLEAARKAYPSSVVVGAAVLHAHGWTTQVPHVIDVAVMARRSRRPIDGVHFVERTRSWYRQHAKDILPPGDSGFEVHALAPAPALADARAADESDQLWVPDEDDLEIPEESTSGA
jgi:hypothetical protein